MRNLYLCPNKQQSNSVKYFLNISQVFNIQRWIFIETAWSDASHLIDSCGETLTKRPQKKLSAHFESTPKTILVVMSKITHSIKQRRTKHQSKSPRWTQLTHHHTEDLLTYPCLCLFMYVTWLLWPPIEQQAIKHEKQHTDNPYAQTTELPRWNAHVWLTLCSW